MSRLTVLIILFFLFLFTAAVFARTPEIVTKSGLVAAKTSSFNDAGWAILYQENFDTDFEAADGQTFGTDDWLIFQLINGGAITVAGGYAQLNAPDFWNAALIRSTNILPSEYKIRTRIGYINYDLTNYEQEDYDDPDFNSHGGYYENGMYFLTLTDDTCVGNQCAELWWHYHRKMVIDVDNHLNYGGGGETFHPVFMVYMAPETNSGGNLLRTWTGTYWDTSPWNWNVAYTYEYDTWYYAELEKKDNYIILRLYDENQNILQATTPVNLNLVNAMDDPTEYLYVGEPHTDDYEGDVRIDEITLLVPDAVDVGNNSVSIALPKWFRLSQNHPNPFNPFTIIAFELQRRSNVKLSVYNILGMEINTLINEELQPGSYNIDWDGKDNHGHEMPAGIYIYQLNAGGLTETRKMLLLK